MRKISYKVLEELLARPQVCERQEFFHDHECHGRITFEHAIIYAGKQVDADWAIVKLCEFSHSVNQYQGGGCLDKEKNQFLALRKLKVKDFALYPRNDWGQKMEYLNKKFPI